VISKSAPVEVSNDDKVNKLETPKKEKNKGSEVTPK